MFDARCEGRKERYKNRSIMEHNQHLSDVKNDHIMEARKVQRVAPERFEEERERGYDIVTNTRYGTGVRSKVQHEPYTKKRLTPWERTHGGGPRGSRSNSTPPEVGHVALASLSAEARDAIRARQASTPSPTPDMALPMSETHSVAPPNAPTSAWGEEAQPSTSGPSGGYPRPDSRTHRRAPSERARSSSRQGGYCEYPERSSSRQERSSSRQGVYSELPERSCSRQERSSSRQGGYSELPERASSRQGGELRPLDMPVRPPRPPSALDDGTRLASKIAEAGNMAVASHSARSHSKSESRDKHSARGESRGKQSARSYSKESGRISRSCSSRDAHYEAMRSTPPPMMAPNLPSGAWAATPPPAPVIPGSPKGSVYSHSRVA